MPKLELICLANSYKLGGRCVAGLMADGTGWVRPVGRLANGTLYPTDYHLDDLTEAGLLDVIEVGVAGPQPVAHQPENWVIDGTTWLLRARPLGAGQIPVLRQAIAAGPELLAGSTDRIRLADLKP